MILCTANLSPTVKKNLKAYLQSQIISDVEKERESDSDVFVFFWLRLHCLKVSAFPCVYEYGHAHGYLISLCLSIYLSTTKN